MELSPSAVSQDQLQRGRVRVHESEAKWHNDLTKWKLRRHRSNCDLRRKMQERDNIVLMTNAGVVTGGTCRSLREDREEDEESLYGSSHNKVSPSTSAKEGSLELRPHTSSSVESPYSSGASEPFTTPSLTLQAQGPSAGAVPQSEPLVLGERRRTPVEPDGAGGLATFPNSASPFSSQTHAQTISSPALVISSGRDQNISSLSNGIPTTHSGSCLTTSSSLTTSDLVNGTGSNLTSGTSFHCPSASMDIPDQALLSTVESLTSVVAPAPGHVSAPQQQALPLYRYSSRAPGGRGGVSASLPRGYRRSEGSSSCLSAGFTPRPFGAKSCRVSSLPRLYNLENSLLKETVPAPHKTAPSRPQKMVTISEVAVRVSPGPQPIRAV
nr:LIM domain only protein 7-like [Salvelinus alpinus]